jgi:hypothetical protein
MSEEEEAGIQKGLSSMWAEFLVFTRHIKSWVWGKGSQLFIIMSTRYTGKWQFIDQ